MLGINENRNTYNSGGKLSFKENEKPSKIPIITKPIDKVENIVNNTVDVFIPETQDEEKKKSHKNMIRVGSTVLVLSAFVLLLNPKFSSGLIKKLKTISTKAGDKAKVDNSFLGKLNKVREKLVKGLTGAIQLMNNANSTKDECFKKICSKSKITKKAHNSITKWFDKISRHTVFSKYENVTERMNYLEEVLNKYKERLPESDKLLLDTKLSDVKNAREYFSSEKITERLTRQEKLMSNLEKDVFERIKTYKNNLFKAGGNRKDIFNHWAEEALMPQRNMLQEEGKNFVANLVGDGKTQKGIYGEVIDILSPHLKAEEKSALEELIKNMGKKMHKANRSECVEYFDKKRDLMLGSAPTDVVTALLSLIGSGIAIGAADSKDDRISRGLTGAFPVIAGLGVSTALTALLYSGGKGMILGAASGMALSGLGSAVNRMIYPKNNSKNITENNNVSKKSEVKNA